MRKTIVTLGIIFFLIIIHNVANAKYLIENQFEVANLNIDRTKPQIEVINISNNNTGYEKFANKDNKINIKIKIVEKNIKNIYLDANHVKAKVENNYIDEKNIKISKEGNDEIYNIELSNITNNGKLKVEIKEGTVVDKGGLDNTLKEIDTDITIDNIAPSGKFTETKISNGKVNGTIILSEKIRKLDGWNFDKESLKAEKEFTNNISYELPIVDYAGNKGKIEINVLQATYINIVYASHNSYTGWSYGYGNYDIAGKAAIKNNPNYKTEALAFNVNGNVEKDFLQVQAYVYTHWGENSQAKCSTTGLIYKYGYNPNVNEYKTMNSNNLIEMNGKKYFQFGGGGINSYNYTDVNGKNPIPYDTALKIPYGISGIKMKLKDYTYFSVIYQILVNDVGWIKAQSDNSECMYNKQKTMSGFRMALVPKSEKQYVLDLWNKDVGTYNLK